MVVSSCSRVFGALETVVLAKLAGKPIDLWAVFVLAALVLQVHTVVSFSSFNDGLRIC